MKKYIDVDLLKSELCNFLTEEDIKSNERYYWGIFDIINSQPAADVEEVNHQKWENMTDIDSAYLNTYRCSGCGTTFWIDEIPEDANYNRCPNCGAKMDKEQG